MIAFLEGSIVLLEASSAVVNVRGVGYQLLLSKKDLEALHVGDKGAFFVHTHVREDAIELFGFKSISAKQVFQLLISVSGVGPKLGLALLSTLKVQQIIDAIISKDIALLSSVPGIGKKTAERLSLELKDKAQKFDWSLIASDPQEPHVLVNLGQAIKSLGYNKAQSDWALSKIDQHDLGLPLEDLVKKTLTLLSGSKSS